MANAERQMPEHAAAAYRDAVDNIFFLKRQQWLATNYVLLLYAAIFVISAERRSPATPRSFRRVGR
jgi:hypothetical protein